MLTMVLVSWGAPLKEGRFGHHGPLTFCLLLLAGYAYVRKVMKGELQGGAKGYRDQSEQQTPFES